ncbi:hypothetical protein NQ318_004885 [Aromia moschata]|uniref:EF-hand domain-containing protein n=1 Tax=Aromia moschata TaxID=1265417 RepID=A0AAV8Z0A6_9CUCU|nr:hypothetical protein NQ318_004885 [Aromia moschata]
MSKTSVEKNESKTSHTQTSETSEKKLGESSKSTLDEFTVGDHTSAEEEKAATVEEDHTRSTFFNQKYIKTTYAEYKQQKLRDEPLFSEVLTLDHDQKDVNVDLQSTDEPSILVTGFGIRNLESLQNALREDQRRSSGGLSTSYSKRSSETETERSSITTDTSAQRLQLQYLLGLDAETEEEHLEEALAEEVEEEEYVYSASKSIKAAQKYLRVHRIFDFFQVIIAHLLSAMPDNPIEFILVYLNRCLSYRSGLGRPPLLYEEKHIEQLCKLMDRMNTGFIEEDQYHKAMTTLGICEYNKKPPLSTEGLVTSDFFIQEALDSETAIFDDLIRRRWIGGKPPSEPRSLDILTKRDSGPYFIPSDLIIKARQFQVQNLDKIVEGEEGYGVMGE